MLFMTSDPGGKHTIDIDESPLYDLPHGIIIDHLLIFVFIVNANEGRKASKNNSYDGIH